MTSNIYVQHSGPEGAPILIIGEAPGSDETRLRQPFVGQSGELLRQVLQSVGFDCASSAEIEEAYNNSGRNIDVAREINQKYPIRFANIVNYQPEGNKFASLTEKEVNDGLRELDLYIQRWKAQIRVCIVLGSVPLQYIARKYGIDKWRGSVVEVDGLTVCATYHPSYIARVRKDYSIFALDLRRAYKIFSEGHEWPTFDFEINPDEIRYYEIAEEIRARGEVTVDIETIKYTNTILCCGFATSSTKAYCLVNSSRDGQLDTGFRRFCEDILGDDSIEKTFHGGVYDVEVFNNNHITVKNYKHDTMVMQHVMAPEMEKTLAFITSIYTNIPYYKDKGKMSIPDNEKGWSDTKNLDRLTLYEYNCIDCVATFQCKEKMLLEIAENPNFQLIYEQEMQMHEVAFELTRNGMLIDEERRKLIKDTVEKRFVDEQRILNACTGNKNFNVGSPPQKKKLLYETWGLPVKTGKDSKVTTDEDAIVDLIGYVKNHAAGLVSEKGKMEWGTKLLGLTCMLKIAGYRKLLGSYIDVDIHPDGRLRSFYRCSGPETGRWACDKYIDNTGLNAQTMPREVIEI